MDRSNITYLLEHGTIEDIRRIKKDMSAILRFQWEFYSELAHQRKEIAITIKRVLNQDSLSNYSFSHWQRSVKYKYGLHPLSTAGSLKDPGGRFNIGAINPQNIPSFPGLYIASDKDTAIQELTGAQSDLPQRLKLSPIEYALTKPQSLTVISASGFLEKVFDVRSEEYLVHLVELMASFKLPKHLYESAKKLGFSKPRLVKKPAELFQSLCDPNWRKTAALFDIPSNSQIFGQLVYYAGIEGILYRSSCTRKDCLVIFPYNFNHTASFIKLDDEPPHEAVPTRIDATNWKISDLSPIELDL